MTRRRLFFVSGKYLDKIGRDRNSTARLFGYGHTTDYLPLTKKSALTFSTARKRRRTLLAWQTRRRAIQGARCMIAFHYGD
jgi:hypothetical protein